MSSPELPPAPPLAPDRDQIVGLALAALGAALFATKGIFVKLALEQGPDPVTILTWRMIVSVPIFVLVGLWTVRRNRTRSRNGTARAREISARGVLTAGLIGILAYYVASYLDFAALAHITAQLNRLILLTYPFFVLALAAIFFGRRVSRTALLAALGSYLGIALIFAHDLAIGGEDVVVGALLVLGAGLAYAVFQLVSKRWIDIMGAAIFTSIAMTAAGMAVLVHFLATHPLDALIVPLPTLALFLALGFFSTVLPAYAISAAIGRIGPERTAVFGNLSPLVTTVLAIVVLGEAFTLWHAAGTALVIAGIVVFTRQTRTGKAPK
ncbi:DMT family transporter [Pelagibacterium montanilacus]|uniref:DMT family transporter n=1 Tax=Pelagibacterium montanilacus TaxID=2185280 RepID=UPI000F8ECA13|nr:DMT family transporter [Pelagibacterium montanilacus]